MDDDLYMTDERRKTVAGFIAALEIFAKYFGDGLNESYFCGGEHDVIYMYVDIEQCPEDSEDGRLLQSLGWHADSEAGNWAYFT
jgi:hypothetical protein